MAVHYQNTPAGEVRAIEVLVLEQGNTQGREDGPDDKQKDTKDKPGTLTIKKVIRARTMPLVGTAQAVLYGYCWWPLLAADRKSDFEETRNFYSPI